jgi:hypothetical protein
LLHPFNQRGNLAILCFLYLLIDRFIFLCNRRPELLGRLETLEEILIQHGRFFRELI